MSKVKIVTDSTCDLPLDLLNKLNVSVIPSNVIFGEEIISHYDITNDEFYQRLQAGETSSTGVPSFQTFKHLFDCALLERNDVIVFTLSDKLSGMYSAAETVRNEFFKDQITIIDTNTVTVEMGLIVYLAAKMAAKGKSKQEILDYVNNKLVPYSQLIGTLDTLKNLKRSGRISAIRWFVGSLLSVKPIIHIENGLIVSPGKVRGKEHAQVLLQKIARKVVNNLDIETMIVGHTHNLERAQDLKDYLVTISNDAIELLICEIGPVVGTHLGIGALGFSWIGKYNDKWIKRR